jgi:aflatoxin B1 aldehyde reductase
MFDRTGRENVESASIAPGCRPSAHNLIGVVNHLASPARPNFNGMMKSPVAVASVSVARLYLGTMTIGWSQSSTYVDEKAAAEMLEHFVAHNERYHRSAPHEGSDQHQYPHHVDTARIYAGGKTETILGKVLSKKGPSTATATILLGTKAHPSQPGGLSPEGIEQQYWASMKAMELPDDYCLHEYYLHQPDPDHDLLSSLRTLHGMVQSGRIRGIGMSNYHASEMQRAFELCKEYQLSPPIVYQGLYNPLNRAVEDELLPVLRANNCAFVAYNPLAAGLLTGKHTETNPQQAQAGRFKNNPNYLPRFYTPSNFEALEGIRSACDREGIGMVEATYRWLLRHSALTADDGLLLGASSVGQLDENLQACAISADPNRGPLPESVLAAFERAWELTRHGAFPYWRSYSADMPHREALDPGASYEAAKKKK